MSANRQIPDDTFQNNVLSQHRPAELIKAYDANYNERKCQNVFKELKNQLKEASADEIELVLEELLKVSAKLHKDFIFAAVKLILGNQHCAQALFEKRDQHGHTKYERYKSHHWIHIHTEEQASQKQEVLKLLKLGKSLHEMKKHGESIHPLDPKHNQVADVAIALREALPTLHTHITSDYDFDEDKKTNTYFTQVLKRAEQDKDLARHRGWKRVALNVAMALGGLGVFYFGAVAYRAFVQKKENPFFFNQTKSQKKVEKVDAKFKAIPKPGSNI